MEGGGSRTPDRGKNGDVRTLPTAKWPPLCLKVLDDCHCRGLAIVTSGRTALKATMYTVSPRVVQSTTCTAIPCGPESCGVSATQSTLPLASVGFMGM